MCGFSPRTRTRSPTRSAPFLLMSRDEIAAILVHQFILSLRPAPVLIRAHLMLSRGSLFCNVVFLRVPAHSLRLKRSYTSTNAHEPLRVLFCGSDEFSIASLRALNDERLRNPRAISSLEVVCRPGKPTGRGLKKIRQGMNIPKAVEKCMVRRAYSTDCKSCYRSPPTAPPNRYFY